LDARLQVALGSQDADALLLVYPDHLLDYHQLLRAELWHDFAALFADVGFRQLAAFKVYPALFEFD